MTSRRRKNPDLKTDRRLRLFLELSSQLRDLEYYKQGMSVKIQLLAGSNTSTPSHKPEEEQLRSFILLFRQFLSDSEPVFIKRIFNDTIRFLVDDEMKQRAIEARDLWDSSLHCGPFKMSLNNEELTPEHALDLWMNGYYFHSDLGKTAELKKFGKGQAGLAHIQLITSLPRLVELVLYMEVLIRNAFDKRLFDFEA